MDVKKTYKDSSKQNENNEDNEKQDQEIKIYRENNHIYFYTEVDRNSISKLNILLREAEEYCV